MSDFRGRKISGMHEYFFDGYEEVEYLDEKGRTRRKLEYHGKIYSFRMSREEMRRLRIRFSVLALLIFGVLAVGLLNMSDLADTFACAFMVIGVLPHFYYSFGLIRFMFLKEEFNNRQFYQSYKRMENGAVIKIVLAGLSFLMCILYLIFVRAYKLDVPNLITCAASAAFLGLSILERRVISKNRYTIIRDKDRVVENADPSKGEKEAKPKPKTLSDFYATATPYEEEEEKLTRKEKRAQRRQEKKAAENKQEEE